MGKKAKKIPEKCVAEEKVQIGGMIGSIFFLGVFSANIVWFWAYVPTGSVLRGVDVSTFSRACSFSGDSKIRVRIFACVFSSFKVGSRGCCYFFKGVGISCECSFDLC